MKEIRPELVNPFACPVCGNDMEIDGDTRSNCRTLAETNTCKKCGARWMDFYTMSRRVVLDEDEKFPDDIEDEFELNNELCSWCSCHVEDNFVQSKATGDAKFCTTGDLYEALMQGIDNEIEVVPWPKYPDDDLLRCPHCKRERHEHTGLWEKEGPFTVTGQDGYTFFILSCPICGKAAPFVVSDTVERQIKIIQNAQYGTMGDP